jgi:hypothetical protein
MYALSAPAPPKMDLDGALHTSALQVALSPSVGSSSHFRGNLMVMRSLSRADWFAPDRAWALGLISFPAPVVTSFFDASIAH